MRFFNISIFIFISINPSVMATRTPEPTEFWYRQLKNVDLTYAHETACNELYGVKGDFTYQTTSYIETSDLFARDYMYARHAMYPAFCTHSVMTEGGGGLTFPDSVLYNLTASNPNNPVSKIMLSDCKLPDGTNDIVVFPVVPIYKNCEDWGCLDICYADVVLRELDSKYEKLGHVGLGKMEISQDVYNPYDYFVLEVLNESPVIQTNSFENFKERTKYMDSRFGGVKSTPEGQKNTTLETAKFIYENAEYQKNYCPKYTIFGRLSRPGHSMMKKVYDSQANNWVTQSSIECGIWRCDTFVNYAYSQVGLKLPNGRYERYLTPIFTAASMPYGRPIEAYDSILQEKIEGIDLFMSNENKFSDLESEEKLDYAIKYYNNNDSLKNDLLINALEFVIEDEEISPPRRAQIIIKAIEENKKNLQMVEILTNSFLSSKIDLSNQLSAVISLFYYYTDQEIKNNILSGLAETYSNYLTDKVDLASIDKVKKIKELFIQQIDKPEKGVFITTLGYLPIIFTYEESEFLLSNIKTPLSDFEKEEVTRVQVLIGLNYLEESEEKWRKFFNKLPENNRLLYSRILASYISDPLMHYKLDQENSSILKTILLENWPESFKLNNHSWDTEMKKWIDTLEILSDEKQEGQEFCYITQHPNAFEKFAYVNMNAFTFENNTHSACYKKLKENLLKLSASQEVYKFNHVVSSALAKMELYELKDQTKN